MLWGSFYRNESSHWLSQKAYKTLLNNVLLFETTCLQMNTVITGSFHLVAKRIIVGQPYFETVHSALANAKLFKLRHLYCKNVDRRAGTLQHCSQVGIRIAKLFTFRDCYFEAVHDRPFILPNRFPEGSRITKQSTML